jgi:hypothetical protein
MAINTVSGNTMLTSGSFPPVRAATTGSNIDVTAGSLLVVDGVQLVAGDRVLVKIRPTQQQKVFTRPIPARGCARQMPAPTRNASPAWRSRWRSAPSMRGQTFICTCADDPVVVGTSLITFAAQSMVASATQKGRPRPRALRSVLAQRRSLSRPAGRSRPDRLSSSMRAPTTPTRCSGPSRPTAARR